MTEPAQAAPEAAAPQTNTNAQPTIATVVDPPKAKLEAQIDSAKVPDWVARLNEDPGDDRLVPWMIRRVDQAKRSATKEILAQIGIDDPAVAKAAVQQAKAREEAEKSASERAAAEKARADGLQTERDDLLKTVSLQAEVAMKGLSPEQQDAVTKLAGDSPSRQLVAIATLLPTWKTAVESTKKHDVETAKAETKAAPLPPLADTKNAPGGPPLKGPPEAPNHLEIHEALRANPTTRMTAAHYFAKHEAAIVAAKYARSAAASK